MQLPNKKYNIIYADPAWNHQTWSAKGRGRNPDTLGHYKVMDFEDIKKLPVPDIADKNCVLFLWGLDQMLPQSLELIKYWGFSYSTVGFNWVKTNKNNNDYFVGMGWWTRANQEMCLLAKKGIIKRQSKSVRRLIVSPREEHSKKPDEIRDRIVQLCGDLPRIELFARPPIPKDWDCWGNEV